MTPKQLAFQTAVEGIIKKLSLRNMEGYFFEDSASCVKAITDMMEDGSTISWGGSESIKECGLMEAVKSGSYQLIDRFSAKTPEEGRELFAKTVLSDYYLMSSNAITYDGKLINIDGNGNRVAALIYGPDQVIVIAGMNKVVSTTEDAIRRVHNIASPPNCIRLQKQTPCAATGMCAQCLGDDCICSQTVITRRSGTIGRIKVLLVAQELGY